MRFIPHALAVTAVVASLGACGGKALVEDSTDGGGGSHSGGGGGVGATVAGTDVPVICAPFPEQTIGCSMCVGKARNAYDVCGAPFVECFSDQGTRCNDLLKCLGDCMTYDCCASCSEAHLDGAAPLAEFYHCVTCQECGDLCEPVVPSLCEWNPRRD